MEESEKVPPASSRSKASQGILISRQEGRSIFFWVWRRECASKPTPMRLCQREKLGRQVKEGRTAVCPSSIPVPLPLSGEGDGGYRLAKHQKLKLERLAPV